MARPLPIHRTELFSWPTHRRCSSVIGFLPSGHSYTRGISWPYADRIWFSCLPCRATRRCTIRPVGCFCFSAGWRYDGSCGWFDGSCGWSEEIRWVELRFSPSRDPICPSYPIIAWDAADSRGSLRNIVEPSYPVGYIGSLYLLDGSGWPLSPPFFRLACCSLHRCYRMFTDVASLFFGTTRCPFCFI